MLLGIAVAAVPQGVEPAAPPSATAATVQFQWTGGSGVSTYWLSIGTTTGGANLYDANQGLNLGVTVSGLPMDGRTLYVRLYSFIDGVWQFNDYTYQTVLLGPAKA